MWGLRWIKHRPGKSAENKQNKQTWFLEHFLEDEMYKLKQVWPAWHTEKAGFIQGNISRIMNNLVQWRIVFQVFQLCKT